MYLVHPIKDKPGAWEVAWTWLPFFLAADRDLIRAVDKTMAEEFAGKAPAEEAMDQRVKILILTKYPIVGLAELLESYRHVNLEERTDGKATSEA
jgi:hypothetical protein